MWVLSPKFILYIIAATRLRSAVSRSLAVSAINLKYSPKSTQQRHRAESGECVIFQDFKPLGSSLSENKKKKYDHDYLSKRLR